MRIVQGKLHEDVSAQDDKKNTREDMPNFIDEIPRGNGEQCTTERRAQSNDTHSDAYSLPEPVCYDPQCGSEDDPARKLCRRGSEGCP